jgi:hypothetical protein
MIPARHQTDEQLAFNIEDINSAISAMPTTPNIYRYLQERSECQRELDRRARIRSARKRMRETVDLLEWSRDAMRKSCGLRYRLRTLRDNYMNSVFHRAEHRNGAWLIGSYRRFNLI